MEQLLPLLHLLLLHGIELLLLLHLLLHVARLLLLHHAARHLLHSCLGLGRSLLLLKLLLVHRSADHTARILEARQHQRCVSVLYGNAYQNWHRHRSHSWRCSRTDCPGSHLFFQAHTHSLPNRQTDCQPSAVCHAPLWGEVRGEPGADQLSWAQLGPPSGRSGSLTLQPWWCLSSLLLARHWGILQSFLLQLSMWRKSSLPCLHLPAHSGH